MNNFERHEDPKEALGVGLEARCIEIWAAGYWLHGKDIWFNDYQMEDFLGRLKDFNLPLDKAFGPATIFVKLPAGAEEGILELDEFAGNPLKWKGQYYIVPKISEIVKKGYDHMIENSHLHRQYLESERKRKDYELRVIGTYGQ
jgi:hypothetical protein